jgi:hypothetical protein
MGGFDADAIMPAVTAIRRRVFTAARQPMSFPPGIIDLLQWSKCKAGPEGRHPVRAAGGFA